MSCIHYCISIADSVGSVPPAGISLRAVSALFGGLLLMLLFSGFPQVHAQNQERAYAQRVVDTSSQQTHSLAYYLKAAVERAPALHDIRRKRADNQLQAALNDARVSSVHAWLSADVLVAPYFNNGGDFISTNPSPEAIGYDVGITNGGLYSAQLHLERNLFTGLLSDALSRQVDARDRTLRYDYAQQERLLRRNVTDMYLAALQQQMLTALARETVDNLQQELSLLENLRRKGLSSSKDYLLLKIELASSQVALRDGMQRFTEALQRLATFCGLPHDTARTTLLAVTLPRSEDGDGTAFLHAYALDSLSISAEQQVFASSYAPQVRLFANTGLNAVETQNIQRRFGVSAGFSLTLPLYDGGQRQQKFEQTQLALQSIREYRQRAEESIATTRSTSEEKLHTLQRDLQDVDGQLADFRAVLDLSRRELMKGEISMIDYLTLLRRHIDLRKQRIALQTDILQETNTLNYWSWSNARQN